MSRLVISRVQLTATRGIPPRQFGGCVSEVLKKTVAAEMEKLPPRYVAWSRVFVL